MSKISIGVVSVPNRYQMGKNLIETLGDEAKALTTLVCDIRFMGSWPGTRKAWMTMQPDCTHHMVIEEDIEVCADFYETTKLICDLLPNKVISFYTTRSNTFKHDWATKRDSSWYVGEAGASGQAVLMPIEYVYKFLNWVDRYVKPETLYEDSRLWGWMMSMGIHTWFTNPCLVQHMAPTQSALGFNNAGKTSLKYIGKNISGLSIDWKKGMDIDKVKIFPEENIPVLIEGFLGNIKYIPGDKSHLVRGSNNNQDA